ncbi:MAG: hypothetical protein AABX61_01390 [Nanoarchaeota archaeon]
MIRREFLSIILPLIVDPIKTIGYQDNSDLVKKISKYVKENGAYSNIYINNKLYPYYEFQIKDDDRLQSSNDYLGIMKKDDNSFMFDFELNGDVDVYIEKTSISNEGIINSNMEDAVNAMKNNKYNNKSLKLVKGKDNKLNSIFIKNLERISSLLNIQ